MKISERTIKRLGELITGDSKLSPYRTGTDLVRFFNEFGTNHIYGQDFPSRWRFAEDNIRTFNGTPTLRKIIIATFDTRDYLEASVFENGGKTKKSLDVNIAVKYLNDFLTFDGYEVVAVGKRFDVSSARGGQIEVDVKLDASHLSRDFIIEQIDKCRSKIALRDYDGAITNARSLVEAVLTAIEKEVDANAPDYDGDLPKLYKRVQKHLNLAPENPAINNSLKQTLTGFISIVCGLSGLSNKMGDRHVREYKPGEHHAVLIVNAAMTFSNFIFDTYAYQGQTTSSVAIQQP